MAGFVDAANRFSSSAARVPADVINYIGGTRPAMVAKRSFKELSDAAAGPFLTKDPSGPIPGVYRQPAQDQNSRIVSEISGSGIPQNPGAEVVMAQNPTRYEDANGNEIAPQSGGGFMDRRGAFTGPNNDPTTPGMTRQYVKAPALTSFNPDDARYAKRQADIQAQEVASQIAMREEAAARAEEENRRRITNEAEDRARRREMEDRAEAFKADQQRAQLELFKAAEEYKAKWSAEHGGTPYSPQAAAQALKHEQKVGVANDHDAVVSTINTDEMSINQDLDMIESGGVPADPKTVSVVEAITGAPFGKVPLDKTQIQQIKIKVAQRAAEARANAALRFQSLMEQMRVTERRQPQEDLEP